jgi:hypothetical protein
MSVLYPYQAICGCEMDDSSGLGILATVETSHYFRRCPPRVVWILKSKANVDYLFVRIFVNCGLDNIQVTHSSDVLTKAGVKHHVDSDCSQFRTEGSLVAFPLISLLVEFA